MTPTEGPYIELKYSSPNKVLTDAVLVSGDLRTRLPNLIGASVETKPNEPCKTTLSFFGMRSVEVWE
jgi:hypothetical protein